MTDTLNSILFHLPEVSTLLLSHATFYHVFKAPQSHVLIFQLHPIFIMLNVVNQHVQNYLTVGAALGQLEQSI